MKKNKFILLIASMAALAACHNTKKETKNDNPFMNDYTTTFQVPPFDKIDTADYMPAFIEGMKQQKAEIDSIVNNPAEPTFDNTILAFDKSGKLLSKVSNVFYPLCDANTNDQMQAIARKINPLLSKHRDEISMNEKLFKRIKIIYDKRNNMKLDSQQIRVVEKYYRDFERLGANLPKDKQDTLKKINAELSTLTLQFGENLLAETKSFQLVIDDKKDLKGLPETVIEEAASAAKERWKVDFYT